LEAWNGQAVHYQTVALVAELEVERFLLIYDNVKTAALSFGSKYAATDL